jgi:hypothetical protein
MPNQTNRVRENGNSSFRKVITTNSRDSLIAEEKKRNRREKKSHAPRDFLSMKTSHQVDPCTESAQVRESASTDAPTILLIPKVPRVPCQSCLDFEGALPI